MSQQIAPWRYLQRPTSGSKHGHPICPVPNPVRTHKKYPNSNILNTPWLEILEIYQLSDPEKSKLSQTFQQSPEKSPENHPKIARKSPEISPNVLCRAPGIRRDLHFHGDRRPRPRRRAAGGAAAGIFGVATPGPDFWVKSGPEMGDPWGFIGDSPSQNGWMVYGKI